MEANRSPGLPGRAYEEVWPALVPRLDSALRGRGVPSGVREEVIQETAARLWERWAKVDSSDDVFPLAFTIARNLVVDGAREHRRVEVRATVESSAVEDPEAVASARIELRDVLRAMTALTPRYRDLLLTEAGWTGGGSSEVGGVVTNMARMRARRRLSALLGRAGGAVAFPYRRFRAQLSRWSASVRQQIGNPASLCSAEVAIACVLTVSGLGAIGALDATEAASSGSMRISPAVAVSATGRSGAGDGSATPASTRVAAPSSRTSPQQGSTMHELSPRLPLRSVPHSEGEGKDQGSFGAWGYNNHGEGEMTAAGEDIRWKHGHRYRNPRCVRRALNEEVSTDCSGGRAPSGYVEVAAAGRKERVDY